MVVVTSLGGLGQSPSHRARCSSWGSGVEAWNMVSEWLSVGRGFW